MSLAGRFYCLVWLSPVFPMIFSWLCHKEVADAFFLKFGFTNKRHQSLNPTNGKPKKKAVFSLYYGDKITTSHDRAFFCRLESYQS